MPEEPTNPMKLEFPGGSLRLSTGNWCYVVLENGGQLHRLGAEVRKNVVDRLLRGLVGPLEGAGNGQIDGTTVHWFLSLSEEHASLYVAQHAGGRTMFVQDAGGALVARLDLTEQLVERWVEALALER